jgi:hypothetical protein
VTAVKTSPGRYQEGVKSSLTGVRVASRNATACFYSGALRLRPERPSWPGSPGGTHSLVADTRTGRGLLQLPGQCSGFQLLDTHHPRRAAWPQRRLGRGFRRVGKGSEARQPRGR